MASPNMDLFEVYFKKADLDGDGRISGAEAVAFFKGSGLTQQVLAQVWMHADQNRTGALGRPEFYNALRLVTVAQSKRDLTPDIVKAALYGPAAAKIPPPKINISGSPAPVQQINPMPAVSAPQMGAGAPTATQNLGFRGPGVPNMNQNYFPSQQTMRPPQAIPPITASGPSQGFMSPDFSRAGNMVGPSQAMPTITASHPPQPMPVSTASGPSQGIMSPEFSRAGNMVSHSQVMPTITASRPPQPMPVSTASPSIPSSNISILTGPSPTSNVTSQLQTQVSPLSQASPNNSKALVVSGNGFTSGSSFGDDIFSFTPSAKRQETPVTSYSSTGPPASANMVPPSSGGLSKKSNSLDSLQNAFTMQPLGGGLQRAQSLPTSGQQVSASSSSSLASPSTSTSVGVGISSDNSQPQWPKMKPSDVQKYTKVFMEVDTDRDGRISGDQARNLFLSWRLPREVLKQVWDLSDQDNDSMLSLREFCIALYLMERFREGRPLPASLPSNLMFDDMLLSMTGQPNAAYGNQGWGPSPGPGIVQHPGMGPRPMGPGPPGSNLRPPVPGAVPQVQPDGVTVSIPQQPRGPVLEESFLNDTERGDRNSTDGKVDEPAKLILDSKEKIEFYRSKMQELVLYKSRCDNRLNEITERAIADKREADMLGKKYEEKYKQVAEVASKLTIEEAQLRDVQERKSELHQAIVNMEQGGSADGILQVRADRIQSDLDELLKALTERCKKHGIEVKSSAMIELPAGWQPGIHESAAVWDEEWDKFEDDGFGNDLTVDVKNLSSTTHKENELHDANLTPDSLSNGDEKSRNFSTSEPGFDGESTYAHSEDEPARSPQSTAIESPSQEFSDVFAKSTDADAETNRSFDESTWGGAFDTHDDTDSVWGFNPASSTKDSDFGTSDFGGKPIRTGSPSTESIFNKKSPFFEDSVAGSPVSRFANSPRYSEAGDQFDNFSRFDSFSMNEGGFSPKERFSRFDSMNSTKDFGQSHNFSSSFDEADPFGSHEPFKVSSDHQTPKRSSDNWNAF